MIDFLQKHKRELAWLALILLLVWCPSLAVYIAIGIGFSLGVCGTDEHIRKSDDLYIRFFWRVLGWPLFVIFLIEEDD